VRTDISFAMLREAMAVRDGAFAPHPLQSIDCRASSV